MKPFVLEYHFVTDLAPIGNRRAGWQPALRIEGDQAS
jgi:hypothetical protein